MPPQFVEGERAILGGLLIDKSALPEVISTLSVDHFYKEAHRHIFSAMTTLFNEGRPVDWVSLTATLNKVGMLDAVGGIDYLTKLADAVPSTANIFHYVTIVKERSVLRKVLTECKAIERRCYNTTGTMPDLLASVNQMATEIYSLKDGNKESHRLIGIEFKEELERLEAGPQVNETNPTIKTGIDLLDEKTGGLFPGNLIVLCARPRMGKTALALEIVRHNIKRGIPAAYFTQEMTRREIARRMAASECQINLLDLKKGTVSRSDLQLFRDLEKTARKWPLLVDEASLTPLEIAAKVDRWNKFHDPICLIVVDHLHILGVNDGVRYQSRERQISTYSGQLKHIAKKFGIPVLVLAQLNRAIEARSVKDRIPRLGDLRDSGSIEADADIVAGLYRQYEDTLDSADIHGVILALIKNRDGPTGKRELVWIPDYATFRNATPKYRQESAPEGDDEIPF